MADPRSAEARMQRLLYVLPAASRTSGASLRELAAVLDVTEERILEDLREVTDRVYYHPGGWPDDVNILLESGRVRVIHAAGLERPVRLSSRETLCLALGLRGAAAASHLGDSERRLALLRRAEQHLGAGAWSEVDATPLHAEDQTPDPAGIRETLIAAARDHHPCAIVYAKPTTEDVGVRVIHPYTLAYAEGGWYVLGLCTVKNDMRVFRVDRIVEAAEAPGTFEVPEDFDATDYLEQARVYRAGTDVEVRVRYSPKVARWVRERAAVGMVEWDEEPDGSVVIRHRVADPHWVVGHALQYGPDAEIIEPADFRDLVRDVVKGMAG